MCESMCEWPNPYPRRATVVALFRVVVKSYPQYGMGRMRSSLPLMDLAMLGHAGCQTQKARTGGGGCSSSPSRTPLRSWHIAWDVPGGVRGKTHVPKSKGSHRRVTEFGVHSMETLRERRNN